MSRATMLAMAAMVMSCVLASGAGGSVKAGSSIRDPIETSTAHTGGDDPILLFTDPADAAVEPWGLMQAHYNRAQPVNATALGGITAPLQAVGLNAAVLVRDAGEYVEVFSQGKGGTGVGEGIWRMQSSDGMRTWSKAELVIDGTACAGCGPKGPKAWFVNAQNMGYRADTGEYLSLIYGGKAKDFPGSPFTSHGALGFVLRSKTGLPGSWTCDNSAFGNATCDLFKPTTIDHDDGSMTFDHVHSQRWVNAQVVLQDTKARVLPSGYVLADNSPGRRVIGWRTSADGRNWSCAPSIMDPRCDPRFTPDSPVTLPDPTTDPPELQWYRARPFRYGDRWAAAVYNYAPSPLCNHAVMACHGPHMGTSWWVNRGALADHAAWTRPYAWQRHSRRWRVMGPHAVLNHKPVNVFAEHFHRLELRVGAQDPRLLGSDSVYSSQRACAAERRAHG